MKVLKASAGSGKTYRLSKEFISLLMNSEDRYAYRHILAVTFTNKATAEMKARILRDLAELAKKDEKAKRILVDILHDYSAFAVSTIDRFFQQTLKSFSREIGQFASYQIELDRKSLITEAMDRILDNLSEDQTDLVNWLKSSVADSVEQGEKISMEDCLYQMGLLLKSEEFRKLKEQFNLNEDEMFAKEKLGEIRKVCRKVISDFHKKVRKEAIAVESSVTGAKAREFLEQYLQEIPESRAIPAPKTTLAKACPDSFFLDCFGEPFKVYNTARAIDKLVFSLGLAGEFYREFSNLLREKNVLSLDDSNTILRDIIDGSDAPFVYEKMGVRFEHFLLDEFQDTSGIQWQNFLPLLKESESGAGGNLIVGDIKQSIYRFRDSDWRLLGEEVAKAFRDADFETLSCNWRSDKNIVEFNNNFFKFAAKAINVGKQYGDVEQTVMHKDGQDGFVHVSFTDDQLGEIRNSINEAMESGARPEDIAILVRGRKEGSEIAASLIGSGYKVISDDSLAVKTSLVVRRLVSVLNSFENPENSVGGFLARSMGISAPESYHSLVDMSEGMLRSMKESDPLSFEGETLFIQAFMDDMRNWCESNGNNLRTYLKHWEESDLYISSPEDSDAIRIITIHKAKGLEYPYVIFPFAEKVERFHSRGNTHWCHLDASGTALGDPVSGAYPVDLTSSAESTLFSESLQEDRIMQDIDNINVFYVALTRPVNGLHIISKTPSGKFQKLLDAGKPEYTLFSEILYEFCGKSSDYRLGNMYDFTRLERKQKETTDFPASYPSFSLGDRLKASDDAFDFFGEDGITTGSAASARLSGIELHAILESIHSSDDIVRIPNDEDRKLLEQRIKAHPEWFQPSGSGDRDINETTVFDTDGKQYRPDRVILKKDGSVEIIDYKFGAEKAIYLNQVLHYMSLYKGMGYKNVSGAVWYVPEDKVIRLSSQSCGELM